MGRKNSKTLCVLLLVAFHLLYFSTGGKAMEGYSYWVGKKAPEINGGTAWLNSKPLTLAQLKGKVVLIDIWEYTCVNCLRTLPYIKEWHRRYAKDGLVIIGVHAPEFEFGKKLENVKRAVKDLGIEYPVVLDNEFRIWRAFANQFWPRKFLMDARGIIRYDHAGEGDYQQTEGAIQQLLKEIHPNLKFPKPLPYLRGEDKPGAVCYPMTPETYAGSRRGKFAFLVHPDSPYLYKDSHRYEDGEIVLNGLFTIYSDRTVHARSTNAFQDYLALQFHASEVNAVFKPENPSPFAVYVTLNEEPVPEDRRGADIQVDPEGKTFMEVDEPRMYKIISGQQWGTYVLKLYTNSPDFAIYAFTFGSCLVPGKE